MERMKHWIARILSLTVLGMTITATAIPASAGQKLLNADFESGTNGFSARASEVVTRTSDIAYEGSSCLMVSSRTNAWNGAVMSMGSSWKTGESYSFSCAVYQNTGETVDMQLSLQYTDSTGTQYDQIALGAVKSGEWTVLSNPEYQLPSGSDMYLYVETKESLCDFYVDSVISEEPAHYLRGDVNHDEKRDEKDVQELLQYLLGHDAEVYLDTADMNGDGKLNAIDLSMRWQFNFYPDLTSTTTTTTTTTTTVVTTKPQLQPGQWYNTADVSWIQPGKKTVALSFDDGPDPKASRIHDALTKQGFHATFFYWGNKINGSNESEIREAEKRGFEVANHTWTHTDLSNLGANDILNEYNQCKNKLNQILGVDRDYLVRLPYLGYSQTVANTLPVPAPNCGIDSQDWNGASSDQIVSKIQQAARDGSLNGKVVLMHETEAASAAAMEVLCPWLDQNGYAVVTVSEMFKYNNKEMYAGRRYDSCF
ncbi:MAG: polysaccharide deacetylase family protein [Oscillospiraceae bacterium]|nr:polysaccharide deacetylase family protein [Oscillospiraceae bacterium]